LLLFHWKLRLLFLVSRRAGGIARWKTSDGACSPVSRAVAAKGKGLVRAVLRGGICLQQTQDDAARRHRCEVRVSTENASRSR